MAFQKEVMGVDIAVPPRGLELKAKVFELCLEATKPVVGKVTEEDWG